jgi:hypothetical protein
MHDSLEKAIQHLSELIEVSDRNLANLPKHASQRSLYKMFEARQLHELALRRLEEEHRKYNLDRQGRCGTASR